jgi:phospholipid/cholesterol/gamma-HCH transport system ATP-binding protein
MPMERQPIIQVRNLTARYGEKTILEGVSFDVFEGEIFVILGGSGWGKSTLLKHLVGLIRPYSGQITIDGDDISRGASRVIERLLRKIGILYQSGALFGSMTIAQNIALPVIQYTDLSSITSPETSRTSLSSKRSLPSTVGSSRHWLWKDLWTSSSNGTPRRAGKPC